MKTFTVLKIESGRTFSSEVTLDEAGVARWTSNVLVDWGHRLRMELDPPNDSGIKRSTS